MKFFLFLITGIFAGIYLSWLGILILNNWRCFKDTLSKEDKIPFRALLEVSSSYLIKEIIKV